METEEDFILVENGDMFDGTRVQFANCFFSNATNDQIIGWCKSQGFALSINNEILLGC